ncbi:PTS sugar transporter subunit IIA [Bombilactobacillus bombi]|uniref:PTS sugar transporter subunit IIA n=1 Tax=Bombilactobacillus bombi TaxID=1303590 RepID=UPI0015E5C5A1|nr:PTS sugar transporter subunit IIA [Bombilactobacillus bombi]MBA1434062.1 PTS sugar transporter subunit IIA [Bombilactobacillus bombi]
MRQIILVSHGNMAEGMVNTIEMISGKHDNLQAFSMSAKQTPDYIYSSVKSIVDKFSDKDEIYIFSDIAGGSVNTEAMKFIKYNNVHLISGMNLPIVIDCLLSDGKNIKQLLKAGKDSLDEIKAKKYTEDNIWEE